MVGLADCVWLSLAYFQRKAMHSFGLIDILVIMRTVSPKDTAAAIYNYVVDSVVVFLGLPHPSHPIKRRGDGIMLRHPGMQ